MQAETSSVNKIHPSIAKDLENGALLCLICNTQVKSKLWIAHSNGRKHRENIKQFKTNHLITNAAKRNMQEPITSSDVIPNKKTKSKKFTSYSSIIQKQTIAKTYESVPWEKSPMSKVVESSVTSAQKKKNIIEGVPEGFFEDEKLNKRVVETIEKEANMEQEYEIFMKELNEAEKEEERREENEEHLGAVEHDIELIDDQINHWKRVNQLELRKD
ncbi:unnamed protein product, partial [Thelazia callipaeda]|uniref:Zinc finger protein 830 n=1 Tax=Thelazia callipaeda TaxID=103827 RepID=A0A0N5CP79_THECL